MELIDIIKEVTQIPLKFKNEDNDKSVFDLLKLTQYFKNYNKILENDIVLIIKKRPSLVDDWLFWSENKRAIDGWYFLKNSIDMYEVGKINQDNSKEEYMQFYDGCIACSIFIKKEIETIRNN